LLVKHRKVNSLSLSGLADGQTPLTKVLTNLLLALRSHYWFLFMVRARLDFLPDSQHYTDNWHIIFWLQNQLLSHIQLSFESLCLKYIFTWVFTLSVYLPNNQFLGTW